MKGNIDQKGVLETQEADETKHYQNETDQIIVKPGMLVVPYLGPYTPTKLSRKQNPKHIDPKTQLTTLDINGHDSNCNPGTLVPKIMKQKLKPPKANIDEETNKEWELVMNIDDKKERHTDESKKKWWEREREVFSGRINLFMKRIHLLQGDRKFKAWKCSIVEVGVFLTQNMSDILSSVSGGSDCAPRGDIHLNVTETQLYDLFNQVAQVTIVRVCRDLTMKFSLGYAYLIFTNPLDDYHMLKLMKPHLFSEMKEPKMDPTRVSIGEPGPGSSSFSQ